MLSPRPATAVLRGALALAASAAPASAQEWGPWYVLGPFDHPRGASNIDADQPVEKELRRMGPGRSGPDLDAPYKGKGREKIRWAPLAGGVAALDVGAIEFAQVLTPPEKERGIWSDNAVAYLYREVTAPAPTTVAVRCGSDDGLRLWLNGELVIDAPIPRPLDPNAHRFDLSLEEGVNHLFVKVANGGGGWGFQLGERHESGGERANLTAIDTSVAAGVERLLATQLVDGSWAQHPRWHAGATAYAAYCLLECGVDPDHPAIQRARAYVLAHPSPYTYSTSCELLFLAELGREQDRERIERRTEELLGWQGSTGLFGYPTHPDGQSHDDLSCTLYAALALRAVDAYGVEVSDRVWQRMANGACACFEGIGRSELSKGSGAGFTYKMSEPPVTGSMTAAGVTVLWIAREGHGGRLPSNVRGDAERAVEAGMAWLAERAGAWDHNPEAGGGHHYFWLYGIERVGSLFGMERIGDVDWYRDGATYLVQQQRASGGWVGDDDTAATVLALLFLKRATAPVLSGKRSATADTWTTDDPAADVSIVATGDAQVSVWIAGLHDDVRERLDAPGARVERVEYVAYADGAHEPAPFATVEPAEGESLANERFPARGTLPERGNWFLVARVHAVAPREPKRGELVEAVFESPPLLVRVRDVLVPGQLEYAAEGVASLVAEARPEASSSSDEAGRAPGHAVDGSQASGWLCAAGDTEPWLRLELGDPPVVSRILLSHGLPSRAHDHAQRVERVAVVLNGEERHELSMHPDPLRKTALTLGEPTRVEELELRVLSVAGGAPGASAVGFAEIELCGAD